MFEAVGHFVSKLGLVQVRDSLENTQGNAPFLYQDAGNLTRPRQSLPMNRPFPTMSGKRQQYRCPAAAVVNHVAITLSNQQHSS